jgi:hypothetical protein
MDCGATVTRSALRRLQDLRRLLLEEQVVDVDESAANSAAQYRN